MLSANTTSQPEIAEGAESGEISVERVFKLVSESSGVNRAWKRTERSWSQRDRSRIWVAESKALENLH